MITSANVLAVQRALSVKTGADGESALYSGRFTKQEHLLKIDKMLEDVEIYEGHFSCLVYNIKEGTITRDYVEAMLDKFDTYVESKRHQTDAKRQELNKKRKSEAEQVNETAATDTEWVAEKQKYGGKGQYISVWKKVRCE